MCPWHSIFIHIYIINNHTFYVPLKYGASIFAEIFRRTEGPVFFRRQPPSNKLFMKDNHFRNISLK